MTAEYDSKSYPGFKSGTLSLMGDSPMVLTQDEGGFATLTSTQQEYVRRVGQTLKTYILAAKELLSGRLAHLRPYVPDYLADLGQMLVACCEEGVVVRYEARRSEGEEKRYQSWCGDAGISQVARMLSQTLIQCVNSSEEASAIDLEKEGAAVTLRIGPQEQTTRFVFTVLLRRPDAPAAPLAKPFCLASIRNVIEIAIQGEIEDVNRVGQPRQRFISHSLLRLPFGWDCIEVFPYTTVEQWNPEHAPFWAETDILAAAVAHQLRERSLWELDPNADARRHFGDLLAKFRALLDRNPEREEELQTFLADNPALLCPAHMAMWPKLALGPYKTDFVFREAAGDYLLVELERSTLRLFKSDGHPTSDFNHAHGQIRDWKRYIEDNLATVQRELDLEGLSAHPRALIVMGRSADLRPEERRLLTTIENESPKLKIMTYDDVCANAKAVIENLFGPLWNVSGNTRILYPRGS